MTSPSDLRRVSQIRTYDRAKSVVFLKTKEEFGGLSNMAGGFPLVVNGLRIFTSEALYQACRFPHMPDIQRLIIAQVSPMTAKMKGKPYRRDSRPDWDRVRVKIMRWCLRVKLAQNWSKFGQLLLATESRPIVEESHKDDFWGAKPIDDEILVGMNVLGRLLMELREELRSRNDAAPLCVEPLLIQDFLLDGQPIQPVVPDSTRQYHKAPWVPESVALSESRTSAVQVILFDRSSTRVHAAPPKSESNGHHASGHDLTPYLAYRDSGVPWLGEVPEHWEMRRNGRLFAQRNETAFPDLPILEVSLKTGVRVRSFDASFRKQWMSDRGKYKRACRGDIAYNMMRMWQGAVGVAAVDGLVSPAYVVARPFPGTEARYFAFLFRTAGYMGEVNNFSRGIVADRNRLYWSDFKQIMSPWPPVEEQSAIIRFLDHADRRIRSYIRAKKKLIALLNEQKQAIIHRAVIRGLDPNVRLKSSGVEWLGDVPERWQVMPLRRVTISRCDGPFGSGLKSSHYTDRGIRVVRLQNIGHAEFKNSDAAFISPAYYATLGDHSVEAGDVLVAGLGDERHPAGRACVAPASIVPAMVKADCFRFRLDRVRLNPEFLALHLTATAAEASAILSTGATRQRTNLQTTAARSIAVPPLEEQLLIVDYITRETGCLRAAVSSAEREIDLLHEYRTCLIADVVAGKFDVREVAAGLPDEAEEPEPLDETEALEESDEQGNDADVALEEAET